MDHAFNNKNILVTGGAGFIGSHLAQKLADYGASITIVDNLITGFKRNIDLLLASELVKIIESDVTQDYTTYLPSDIQFDFIFHLASIASPVGYAKYPLETAHVNGPGTEHMAKLAQSHRATLVYTSTSETYGDPLVHPQTEEYWGNVNPVGPRACYDVSKRYGEMIVKNYIDLFDIDARIVRIFNTYGPHMDLEDGRVVPNFINQIKSGDPLSVHGDGAQTRSFCYIDDLIEYIVRASLEDNARGEVINIGNPEEVTIKDLAQIMVDITKHEPGISFQAGRKEDIARRQPDISKAISLLDYSPQISLQEGLKKTLNFYEVATQ